MQYYGIECKTKLLLTESVCKETVTKTDIFIRLKAFSSGFKISDYKSEQMIIVNISREIFNTDISTLSLTL